MNAFEQVSDRQRPKPKHGWLDEKVYEREPPRDAPFRPGDQEHPPHRTIRYYPQKNLILKLLWQKNLGLRARTFF
jgi:hypothetical protein